MNDLGVQIAEHVETQRQNWARRMEEAVEEIAAKAHAVAVSPEVRVTDPVTGGAKGRKPEEYALIPVRPLEELARAYGYGANKYASWNWTRGYAWSLSLSAMQRHIEAWRRGESRDPESGCHHLAMACFHAFTLSEFERLTLGTDDRWKR